jgi:hypothetical protein
MRISRRGGTISWATTFKVTVADDAPMSKEEFQHLCRVLKITNSEDAAVLFGLSWRTCQRYWYGDLDVPGPLARLLRIAVQQKLTTKEMRKLSRPLSIRTPRQDAGTDL